MCEWIYASLYIMYLRWNFVILGFNWYSLLEFLIKDNKNFVTFVCRIFDVTIEKLLLLIINICFRNHLSNSNICNWRVIKIHAKSFEPTLVSEQLFWKKVHFYLFIHWYAYSKWFMFVLKFLYTSWMCNYNLIMQSEIWAEK